MRLLVALVVVALVTIPSGQAGPEMPHHLLRFDNSDMAMTLRVSFTRFGEETPYLDLYIDVPLGHSEERVDTEAGPQTAVIAREDPMETGLTPFGEWVSGRGAWNDDCPGAFALDVVLSSSEQGMIGGGCLVPTAGMQAMLDEARAATAGRARPKFDVPAPGSADRGVFGDDQPFEWREATFDDGFGRAVPGHEVVYLSFGGAGWIVSGISNARAEYDTMETPEVFRYLPHSPRPVSWSRTIGGFGDSGVGDASVTLTREMRYDDAAGFVSCMLRSELQGRAFRPGDVVPPSEFCGRWDGPDWRAAAPITWRGFEVLPLYQLEESAESLLVARVLLVDGLPYPLEADRYELPVGEPIRVGSASLEKFAAGGDPVPLAGAAPNSPALARLDALRGPSDASGRFTFTLAQASDAARADLTLVEAQQVIARADAALLGARYSEARDPTTGIMTRSWGLVFGAKGAAVASVHCELVGLPGPLGSNPRCERVASLMGLHDAPPVGRDSLPSIAASFELALTRWGSSDAPTTALYRTWANEDGGPVLVVGARPPGALVAVMADDPETSDTVALVLATARTLAQVEVVEETARFDPTAIGDVGPKSLRAVSPAFGWVSSLPSLVGAGVGLALVALLGFLLYSRLVRARVLDDATRAAIHDVVANEPGLHASAVLAQLGKHSGVGEYHLDVLVREGYLTSVATPGFRRYYVTGRHTPAEMRAMAAMREGQNVKLMHIIRANPGIELRMLAAEAGVSVPYVSRSVQRLADAGLVEKVQVGRSIAVHSIEA